MLQHMFTSSRRAAASLQSAITSNISRASSSSSTRFLSSAAIANDDEINDGRFSIQGTFREGQASYLDMSATTPLDPRVLDKMMPYMVRFIWFGILCMYHLYKIQILLTSCVLFFIKPYHCTLCSTQFTIRQ